ncbi:hypothetical protein BPO_0347 [Bergeyella porcorum]|uniref:Uncharacterized protein n=1 Tax=Bergeyella porcorum TaxID=1735111 RepID=A0AAU0F008_9FLAO
MLNFPALFPLEMGAVAFFIGETSSFEGSIAFAGVFSLD